MEGNRREWFRSTACQRLTRRLVPSHFGAGLGALCGVNICRNHIVGRQNGNDAALKSM